MSFVEVSEKLTNGYLLFEKLMYRVSILMYVIGIENMNEVSVSELMPFRKIAVSIGNEWCLVVIGNTLGFSRG